MFNLFVFILAFFRVCPLTSVCANELKTLDKLIQLNSGANSCEFVTSSEKDIWYSSGALLGKFFKGVHCEMLFSKKPADFTGDSNSGLLKIEDQNWFPVCSPYFSWKQREKHPKFSSLQNAKAIMDEVKERDECQPPPLPNQKTVPASSDRYSKAYHAPSQKDLHYRPLNETETKKIKAIAVDYQARIGASCCQKNMDCLNAFSKIAVKFCEPQKDPTVSEPCIKQSSYFSTASRDGLLSFDTVDPGVMLIALFFDQDSKSVSDDINRVLAHELGHACSSIKRKIAVKNGDNEVYQDFVRISNGTACDDKNPIADAIYGSLYSDLGLNAQSSQCVLNLRSKNMRFVDEPCENACPRSQIEEAFGNMTEIMYYDSKKMDAGVLVQEVCGGERDSHHPLTMDVFKCMMSTPTILNKFETASGCIK